MEGVGLPDLALIRPFLKVLIGLPPDSPWSEGLTNSKRPVRSLARRVGVGVALPTLSSSVLPPLLRIDLEGEVSVDELEGVESLARFGGGVPGARGVVVESLEVESAAFEVEIFPKRRSVFALEAGLNRSGELVFPFLDPEVCEV